MDRAEKIINEVHNRVTDEMPNMTDAHDETWEEWAELAESIGKNDLADWLREKQEELENQVDS